MKEIKKYGQLNQLESWMNEETRRLDHILWSVQTKLLNGQGYQCQLSHRVS